MRCFRCPMAVDNGMPPAKVLYSRGRAPPSSIPNRGHQLLPLLLHQHVLPAGRSALNNRDFSCEFNCIPSPACSLLHLPEPALATNQATFRCWCKRYLETTILHSESFKDDLIRKYLPLPSAYPLPATALPCTL